MMDVDEWTGWMHYNRKEMIEHYKYGEDMKNARLMKAQVEVKKKLRKWQSHEKLREDDPYYLEEFDDAIWYHLERTEMYYDCRVINLKKWRKARENCHKIIRDIKAELESKRKTRYHEVKDDPQIPKVPKDPIFEAWESFSIVSFELNCFGFDEYENLLSFTENFVQPY
jgi:hypothetical protein